MTASLTCDSADDFATLLEESLKKEGSDQFYNNPFERRLERGYVVDVNNIGVLVDVGLKAEGLIALEEFESNIPKKGDTILVYIERYDGREGLMLSRSKALQEEIWEKLQTSEDNLVDAIIVQRVKGGFTVDVEGLRAFLPNSQAHPEDRVGDRVGVQVVRAERDSNNLVVSRKHAYQERKSKALDNLQEGQIVKGSVANVVAYGAFVDVGGITGLLHATDMSWGRERPELLAGQRLELKVLKIDREQGRISLGLKQFNVDPWEGIDNRYSPGQSVNARVVEILDHGVFVEMEPGVEAFVDNENGGKGRFEGQNVRGMVVNINHNERCFTIGLSD